jgi:hypothetical protein
MKKKAEQETGVHDGGPRYCQIGVRVSEEVRDYYERLSDAEARTLSNTCAMVLEDYKNRVKDGSFKEALKVGKQKFTSRGNSRGRKHGLGPQAGR